MKRLLLAASVGLIAINGYAQDYPSRAITITVPNPPGGMNQIHAQPLSDILEKLTKQPAPIVNRSEERAPLAPPMSIALPGPPS